MADGDLRPWQLSVKRQLEALFSRSDFQEDLAEVRLDTHIPAGSRAGFLIQRYSIPFEASTVLIKLIEENIVDYSEIYSPIRVYSDADKLMEPAIEHPRIDMEIHNFVKDDLPRTYLVLEENITKTELISFINEYWDSVIEPKLVLCGRTRKPRRAKPQAKLHERMAELSKQGLSSAQIAEILTDEVNDENTDNPQIITEEAVRQALRRNKIDG